MDADMPMSQRSRKSASVSIPVNDWSWVKVARRVSGMRAGWRIRIAVWNSHSATACGNAFMRTKDVRMAIQELGQPGGARRAHTRNHEAAAVRLRMGHLFKHGLRLTIDQREQARKNWGHGHRLVDAIDTEAFLFN
jgi:hypothetical protein